jgi:hypothetical protein
MRTVHLIFNTKRSQFKGVVYDECEVDMFQLYHVRDTRKDIIMSATFIANLTNMQNGITDHAYDVIFRDLPDVSSSETKVVKISPCQDDSCLDSQEIPRLFGYPKCHFCVHKNPPMDPLNK